VEVRDGDRIKFWEDPWTQDGILKNLFPVLYMLSNQQHTEIAKMGWFEGQVWKWVLVWRRELSSDELKQADTLHAFLAQHHILQNKKDLVKWNVEKGFTVKALQQMVHKGSRCDNLVCRAWMNLAPPKMEFLMWLALFG